MRVYLNGKWMDADDTQISFDDRGFLFGDAVYEVIRLYDGRPFELDAHLDRLARSQRAIWLEETDRQEFETVIADFCAHEGSESADAIIYIEVSRGASPRSHAFPMPPVKPTVMLWCRPVQTMPWDQNRTGIKAITVPDDRWAKCWIKTVNLLPNVLAKEKAHRADCDDALFVRDGMVIEATSANLFIVSQSTLITAPVTNYILPGITRQVILELAGAMGIPVLLEPFTVETLMASDEVFITGTTSEILPVTVVDHVRLRNEMGPVARRLLEAFRTRVGRSLPDSKLA